MQQYLELLQTIKDKGTHKPAAREGMPGTTSLFGYQFRHDLADGFPLLTTKKLSLNNILFELLWFMKGDTNIKFLRDHGCKIWDEDAYNYYKKLNPDSTLSFTQFLEYVDNGAVKFTEPRYRYGDCGKQYGWLWRNWNGIDQLEELVKGLRYSPMSRRHIITAWNPETLGDMALNACHAFVQFNCRPLTYDEEYKWICNQPTSYIFYEDEKGHFHVDKNKIPQYKLDCQLYQRSADVFLGVPYNIASYAMLTELIAKMCNMISGEFVHTFGDVHIYDNHKEQVDLQLTREPRPLPKIKLDFPRIDFRNPVDIIIKDLVNESKNMEKFNECMGITNYNPHPTIKAKLSTGLK